MTKIEELEQKLNECQKELAELKESKKEGKWKPEYKNKYWIRDDGGEIGFDVWDNHEIDIWRYNNLPIFPTKEECERYWHFMDTVKEKSYEFSELDWRDDDIAKWVVEYDYLTNQLRAGDHRYIKHFGLVYFKNEEEAKYIIDNFKDELMEYFV